MSDADDRFAIIATLDRWLTDASVLEDPEIEGTL